MNPESLYDILKIRPSATLDEIKGAYRRQAMKWHPDRNLNNRAEAEERFKKIAYAYKVLSDAQLRAEYDTDLASQQHSGSGQEQDSAASGPGMSEDDAARMFFEQMLDLAFELSRRGFDEAKIIKMLLVLDCPESIAKVVANQASRNRNQQSTTGANNQPSSGPIRETSNSSTAAWEAMKPYFTAALVSPYFSRSEQGGFKIIKAVRYTLFAALSVVLFSLLSQGNIENPDDFINILIVSVLIGWGAMFFILEFSATHRHYLQQERLDT